MRYHGNKLCRGERTSAAADGQPENIVPLPTLMGDESITIQFGEQLENIVSRIDMQPTLATAVAARVTSNRATVTVFVTV